MLRQWYFAYGSNMLTSRFKARVPSGRYNQLGHLKGWELTFDVPGWGESSVAGIRPSATEDVWGILYTMRPWHLGNLDRAEGSQYRRIKLDIQTAAGKRPAWIYIPLSKVNAVPYDWYKDHIIVGAFQHVLPDEYVEGLRRIRAMKDDKPERAILEISRYRPGFTTSYMERLMSSR